MDTSLESCSLALLCPEWSFAQNSKLQREIEREQLFELCSDTGDNTGTFFFPHLNKGHRAVRLCLPLSVLVTEANEVPKETPTGGQMDWQRRGGWPQAGVLNLDINYLWVWRKTPTGRSSSLENFLLGKLKLPLDFSSSLKQIWGESYKLLLKGVMFHWTREHGNTYYNKRGQEQEMCSDKKLQMSPSSTLAWNILCSWFFLTLSWWELMRKASSCPDCHQEER